ncbi:MBL fold metallo-hydrolase [Mesonia aestuariivivens]|uniref:MBL fold metallo-hydrolase n=1 Tax=Mesonia aestuariivivens TaxID=2796128 RepID=A0ABS6W1Q6_9FLAO|nr:MBL fold metallo-hydrolase [Mesonia aestuariivivens]MBW2961466.1 MBL fold metallo-hydrolase [Mesonia aestuariivivens]
MNIKQFNDKALAHYSYAIVSEGKMAVVDPARNPMPYYQYAEENNAKIVAVLETHPHADFVSSHYQIHQETGASIYVSKLLGADYPHQSFDDGDHFIMGNIKFSAINSPGHSPDSITILAEAEDEKALFTGDTLFIGNVGRPDLREKAGNMHAKREELAKQMYYTIKDKFTHLPNETLVYPAHGAGSLCGKNMSDASSSTLGNERVSNWAFKEQTEEEFVNEILSDQPMIPYYFGFDVDTNKKGADNFSKSIGEVPLLLNVEEVEEGVMIIDIRAQQEFKENYLLGSINIQGIRSPQKLETWLGAIVQPKEAFYLVVPTVEMAETTLSRVASIGYEKQLKAVITLSSALASIEKINLEEFKNNIDNYTIVDIRNVVEVVKKKPFKNSINIPLHELRERANEVPTDKPIVVHCAAGYRSAVGSSILKRELKNMTVLDLSDAIKYFM